MFESTFKPKPKTPDALHGEHLKEGVRPILSSLNDLDTLDETTANVLYKIREGGEFIDYYASPLSLEENNILNAGRRTYAISIVDESNKWSEGYWNCTGVVIVGTDRETGKEISMLSHQDPWEFLGPSRNDFEKDLTSRISIILDRCEKGTVDAVVFGGHYNRPDEHEESIERISKICQDVLGFEPVVLTGPSINTVYQTEGYFDTNNRRLYLVRPQQPDNKTNQSYVHSAMKEAKKQWIS